MTRFYGLFVFDYSWDTDDVLDGLDVSVSAAPGGSGSGGGCTVSPILLAVRWAYSSGTPSSKVCARSKIPNSAKIRAKHAASNSSLGSTTCARASRVNSALVVAHCFSAVSSRSSWDVNRNCTYKHTTPKNKIKINK